MESRTIILSSILAVLSLMFSIPIDRSFILQKSRLRSLVLWSFDSTINLRSFGAMTLLTLSTVNAVAINFETVKPFTHPNQVRFPKRPPSNSSPNFASLTAAILTLLSTLLATLAAAFLWVTTLIVMVRISDLKCTGARPGTLICGGSCTLGTSRRTTLTPVRTVSTAGRTSSCGSITLPSSPTVLGVSVSQGGGYARYAPPYKRNMDGDSPKIKYYLDPEAKDYHWLEVAFFHGDFRTSSCGAN